MKKVIKILSHIILTLAFIAYIAYQFRTDPIGILAGKRVTGEEMAYPADWSFSNDHMLMAVETRPGNEHSVTTIGFIHKGDLHIPARDGAEKTWPTYVASNPMVRIKVGDSVYPAKLNRVMQPDREAMLASMAEKYPQAASQDPAAMASVWIYQVTPR